MLHLWGLKDRLLGPRLEPLHSHFLHLENQLKEARDLDRQSLIVRIGPSL